MEANSVRFADAARSLGAAAVLAGLVVPTFRSPPKRPSALRTLRYRKDGTASVAVALHGRPWMAVLADMIDGIVAANRIAGEAAGPYRDDLWRAVSDESDASPTQLSSVA